VLIVDDQPVNIQSMSKLLNKDYHILIATSGAKALDIATGENPPDLILLDIIMPEMDGYEVCRRLKANEQTQDIPVIFVTVMDATEDEETGLALGAVDYIFKSFQPSIVRARVRNQIERKRAEEALRQANKKLNLLSSITRHDINNQLTVQMGYLSMLEMKQPDTTNNEYFQKVSIAAKRISAMIRFTREYEEIGVHAPAWQNIRTLMDTAAKEAPLGKVMVNNDLPAGTKIYADPLIVKVFYCLVDNAVRYGGKITTIRFFALERAADHVIVCEDDGDGVVAEEKEQIFKRGFGKNTGLGLALSREILDITGISIRETGEPGKGARFEITVPRGAWLMAGDMENALNPAGEQLATLPPLPETPIKVTKEQGDAAIVTLIGDLKNNELVNDDLLATVLSFLDSSTGKTSSSELRKLVENFEYDAAVSLLMKLATKTGVK